MFALEHRRRFSSQSAAESSDSGQRSTALVWLAPWPVAPPWINSLGPQAHHRGARSGSQRYRGARRPRGHRGGGPGTESWPAGEHSGGVPMFGGTCDLAPSATGNRVEEPSFITSRDTAEPRMAMRYRWEVVLAVSVALLGAGAMSVIYAAGHWPVRPGFFFF